MNYCNAICFNNFLNCNYEFVDYELPIPAVSSVFFYRLKQNDYDGRREYYGPVSVTCSPPDEWNLIFQNIIYDEELKGTLFITENSEVKISVIDLQGRIVKEEKMLAGKGSNLFKIELGDVEKGVYLIKANDREKGIVKKFIKL